VEEPPLVMDVGEAVKEEMVGELLTEETVTVALAVTEPALLVAMRV